MGKKAELGALKYCVSGLGIWLGLNWPLAAEKDASGLFRPRLAADDPDEADGKPEAPNRDGTVGNGVGNEDDCGSEVQLR